MFKFILALLVLVSISITVEAQETIEARSNRVLNTVVSQCTNAPILTATAIKLKDHPSHTHFHQESLVITLAFFDKNTTSHADCLFQAYFTLLHKEKSQYPYSTILITNLLNEDAFAYYASEKDDLFTFRSFSKHAEEDAWLVRTVHFKGINRIIEAVATKKDIGEHYDGDAKYVSLSGLYGYYDSLVGGMMMDIKLKAFENLKKLTNE